MSKPVYAWHFTNGNKLRDGSPLPAIGETLRFNRPIRICKSGYHASRHPFDALKYAPGAMLHYVKCEDVAKEQDDKLVCRHRTIIASIDATELLRYFARMRALSVIHLWNAPEPVIEYLMTGEEPLRYAAEAAARDAAWAAAEAAARDAAWAAARDAAWAAWSARAATEAAARAAVWAYARDAEWDDAWDAAWDAAGEDFVNQVCENFNLTDD